MTDAARGWGRSGLAMYIVGLTIPIALLEHSVWFPGASIDSLPAAVAIGILLAGPAVSAVAVVNSNWSIPMTIMWTLLIPVLLFVLFLVHWIGGSVLLGRPFLTLD